MFKYHYSFNIKGLGAGDGIVYGNNINNARTKARLEIIEGIDIVEFTISDVYRIGGMEI